MSEEGPAYKLEGLELDDGWIVDARIGASADATGGQFSCGYPVQKRDGSKVFLKALDFSRALRSPDPASALQSLTEAYNFERNLLRQCKQRRMDRIVSAIADGKITVNESYLGVVQYLIFEHAESDLRLHLNSMDKIETAWKLRSLHHIATGLKQLHGSDIAHQDLKPSNVLVFNDDLGDTSKLADLGCASVKASSSPRDKWHSQEIRLTRLPNVFMGSSIQNGFVDA